MRVEVVSRPAPLPAAPSGRWPTEAWGVAFVGRTRRGPVATPVVVRSERAYARHFGWHAPPRAIDNAVAAFFAQGGSACTVVRWAPTHAEATAVATALLPAAHGPGKPPSTAGDPCPPLLRVRATSPGAWAEEVSVHLRVGPAGPRLALVHEAARGTVALRVHAAPRLGPGAVVRIQRGSDPPVLRAVRRVGGHLVELEAPLPWDCAPADPTTLEPVAPIVCVEARGESERIGPAPLAGARRGRLDALVARCSRWVRLEVLPAALDDPVRALRHLDGHTATLRLPPPGARKAPSRTDTLGRALAALAGEEATAIVCLPDTAEETDPTAARRALAALGDFAEARRDCFALLDLPGSWSPGAVARWRATTPWSHAVALYPPLHAARRRGPTPASGPLAACLADAMRRGAPLRRPWGTFLRGVVDTLQPLSHATRTALRREGVCVLHAAPGRGVMVEGSATTACAGACRSVAATSVVHAVVRRARAIARASVFEPYTPRTVTRVEAALAQAMSALARRGCFRDGVQWQVSCRPAPPHALEVCVVFAPVGAVDAIRVVVREDPTRRVEEETAP